MVQNYCWLKLRYWHRELWVFLGEAEIILHLSWAGSAKWSSHAIADDTVLR